MIPKQIKLVISKLLPYDPTKSLSVKLNLIIKYTSSNNTTNASIDSIIASP